MYAELCRLPLRRCVKFTIILHNGNEKFLMKNIIHQLQISSTSIIFLEYRLFLAPLQ